MGLFSDLPSPTKPDDAPKPDNKSKSTWSVNTLKPPPSIAVKREGTTPFVPPSLIRSRGSKANPSAAPQDSNNNNGNGNNNNTHLTTATPSIALSLPERILEEYDPEFPNNYEALRQSREVTRREVEEEADRQERMREERMRDERIAEMQLLAALDAAEEDYGGGGTVEGGGPLPSLHRVMPPVQEVDMDMDMDIDIKREAVLGVSGDEAWRRRGIPSHHHHHHHHQVAHPPAPTTTTTALIPPPPLPPPPPPPITSSTEKGGMTFAQKLMAKMGWKEGEGLGKQKQGIAAPLQVRKTADRAGIIVPGELSLLGEGGGDIKDKSNNNSNSNKSRVVVVRNVVGPGEVGPSLDEEIGTHCLASGYGEVEDVVVYEVIEPDDFPVEEVVRVFVKFSSVEEAGRAVDGWDGRLYENKNKRARRVRVGYFDEERFERGDLGPTEEEVERYYYDDGWREGGGGGGGGGKKKKKGGRGRGR